MEDGMNEATTSDKLAVEASAPPKVEASDDRNPIFEMLVSGDDDIVGLVAYSIYKQNKRDWLMAFNKSRGREPDDDEVASYIIGDSTPRRIATFRHLAQAALDRRAPETLLKPAQAPALVERARDPSSTMSLRVSFLTLGLVVVMAVYVAVRLGLPGR